MSATDELRRLLDERGIANSHSHGDSGMVVWSDGTLTYHAGAAFPVNDPTRTKLVMHVTYPTPEQAVEATLGRGECHVVREYADVDGERMTDYSCGCMCQSGWNHNYCPNCGRRVVDA